MSSGSRGSLGDFAHLLSEIMGLLHVKAAKTFKHFCHI